MEKNNHAPAENFYEDIIDVFADKYPRLLDQGIGMVKVLHAFDDKIPLIKVLLKRNLLFGLMLKKSSSDLQKKIADQLEAMLLEHDILLRRSTTTYANMLPSLDKVVAGRKFVLGDHGGYYAHLLKDVARHFGQAFIGNTEHTLNGEERSRLNLSHPYLSTARLDLKERSDRKIASAIAAETIKMVKESSGIDLLSARTNTIIMLIGYGLMGMSAARHLKALGCQAQLIVTDVNAKKTAFAVQDGYEVVVDMESMLPFCDVIVLATNTIIGTKPVFEPRHFGLLKDGVCITSMTSFDDEARQVDRMNDGTIKPIGHEGCARVYQGPTGKRFTLLLDGRPTNVGLVDGGADESIHMVEAAGVAGAFVIADQKNCQNNLASSLADEDGEVIAALWLKHFKKINVKSNLSAFKAANLIP